MATKNVILFKGDALYKEAPALASITPGMLVDFLSSGVGFHATASGTVRRHAFADFADFVGDGIDTAYTSGDTCKFMIPTPGSEINALVQVSGAAIVVGDPVCSAGDGTLVKYSAQLEGATSTAIKLNTIVGYALKAVDNSAGATAASIKIEVK